MELATPYIKRPELFSEIIHLIGVTPAQAWNIIDNFQCHHPLFECRHYLWAMVESTLISDSRFFTDGADFALLITFYQRLETLLEAVWILHPSPYPELSTDEETEEDQEP
jgi:hypothetical protein